MWANICEHASIILSAYEKPARLSWREQLIVFDVLSATHQTVKRVIVCVNKLFINQSLTKQLYCTL